MTFAIACFLIGPLVGVAIARGLHLADERAFDRTLKRENPTVSNPVVVRPGRPLARVVGLHVQKMEE